MTVMKIQTRERLYKIRKEKDEERENIEVEIVQNLNFTNIQKEGSAAVLYCIIYPPFFQTAYWVTGINSAEQ